MCIPSKNKPELKDAKTYIVSFDANDLLAAVEIGMLEEQGRLASLDCTARTSHDYWALLMLTPEAIEALSTMPEYKLTLAPPGRYLDWQHCRNGNKERFVLEPGGKAYLPDELETIPELEHFDFKTTT